MGNHPQIRMGNIGTTFRVGGKWGEMGKKGTKYPFCTVPFPPFLRKLKTFPTAPFVSQGTHRRKNRKFFPSLTLTAAAASAEGWCPASLDSMTRDHPTKGDAALAVVDVLSEGLNAGDLVQRCAAMAGYRGQLRTGRPGGAAAKVKHRLGMAHTFCALVLAAAAKSGRLAW